MSFSPATKHSASLTPLSKNTATFDGGVYFMLQEMGDYLLQENGGRIILEESYQYKKPASFTGETKNPSSFIPATKHTASFSGMTKH